MLYIVTALYIEAKPLILLFDLKKDNKYTKFQVFSNDKVKLIISGTGRIKSSVALTCLVSNLNIEEKDFVVNIGFVASCSKKSNLGDIILANKIKNAYSEINYYPEIAYKHNFIEGSISTFDKVIEKSIENVEYIDMEAYGFFQTASIFFKKNKILTLKIVSDILKELSKDRKILNFEDDNSLNKIYSNIYNFLLKILNYQLENKNNFSNDEQDLIKKILENLKLSDTMTYELLNILKYFKIKYNHINFLEKYSKVEVKSKKDGKLFFEEIKSLAKTNNNIEKKESITELENNKNTLFLQGRFSHIYVERKVLSHKNTKDILSKFENAKIIVIENYKEVFSNNNQDFRLQKLSQNLILASNKDNMIYAGAKVCENFDNDNFYYTSSIINCIYDCEYCYLQGVYPSANIVIFVDIENVFEQVTNLYEKLGSLYLCVSYDTDLLAIENICNFSKKWYHFIKDKQNLKIEMRTKSGNIDSFLELKPIDNFILAFTLSPQNIVQQSEKNTGSLKSRVEAIKKLQGKGWSVRICIDPIIYYNEFEKNYSELIKYLFSNIDRNKIIDISIGVFRTSKDYLKKMRSQNNDSEILYYPFECVNGVYTYSDNQKNDMLKFVKDELLKYIDENKIFM